MPSYYTRGKTRRVGTKSKRFGRRNAIPKGRTGYLRTGGNYKYRGRGLRGSAIRPELKWFDRFMDTANAANRWVNMVDATVYDTAVPPNTWITNQSCNLIASGSGSSERIGRKITVKSVTFDYTLNPDIRLAVAPPRIAGISFTYRLMLVLDKQCNGTTASAQELLTVVPYTNTVPNSQSSPVINWLMNIANTQRFQILKTWSGRIATNTVEFDQANAADYAQNYTSYRIHGYKKVNFPVEYGGPDPSLANIKSNNLFVCMCWTGFDTGGGAVYNNYFTVQGVARIRYTDA